MRFNYNFNKKNELRIYRDDEFMQLQYQEAFRNKGYFLSNPRLFLLNFVTRFMEGGGATLYYDEATILDGNISGNVIPI